MKKIEFLLVIFIFFSFFAAFHPSMNEGLNKEDRGTFNSFEQISSELDSSSIEQDSNELDEEYIYDTYVFEPYLHYEIKRFPDKAYLIY